MSYPSYQHTIISRILHLPPRHLFFGILYPYTIFRMSGSQTSDQPPGLDSVSDLNLSVSMDSSIYSDQDPVDRTFPQTGLLSRDSRSYSAAKSSEAPRVLDPPDPPAEPENGKHPSMLESSEDDPYLPASDASSESSSLRFWKWSIWMSLVKNIKTDKPSIPSGNGLEAASQQVQGEHSRKAACRACLGGHILIVRA